MARNVPQVTAIRDSKDPAGPLISSWAQARGLRSWRR
ncbi:hypothetical protein [Streptomyces auratus]